MESGLNRQENYRNKKPAIYVAGLNRLADARLDHDFIYPEWLARRRTGGGGHVTGFQLHGSYPV